jgi:hypothetical protein
VRVGVEDEDGNGFDFQGMGERGVEVLAFARAVSTAQGTTQAIH